MNEPSYHLDGVVRARDSYSDFDGPLDLILLLLSKNRIAIADIQISSILEQYLAYLDEMKRMDLEIASEFIEMASQLLFIKSRMLLKAGDEEALSEMELLIRSLEERQRKEDKRELIAYKNRVLSLVNALVLNKNQSAVAIPLIVALADVNQNTDVRARAPREP